MSKLAQIGNMPEILRICAVLQTLPQVDCPLQHYFLPGICLRVIHKHEHIAMLLEGVLRLADDEHAYTITAPWISMGKPGIKRLGYAETDCLFANILATTITDIDELEREMVVDMFAEYDDFLLENEHDTPKQIT
jgi:hypothetical protein